MQRRTALWTFPRIPAHKRRMSAAAALDPLAEVARRYAVAITPAMEALIDPADPADPIARQFRPDARELAHTVEERADPIGDDAFSPTPGLVHRYKDRVLLKLVSACPVYCRFCFRRESVGPGAEAPLRAERLDAALAYIAKRPEIWEVILTGGDPFVISAARAAEVTARLAALGHVRVVRWHTRVPVVDPNRITPAFVAALRHPALAVWVAVHANHPRELTPAARAAIGLLVDAGIPVVSQSVLLAGVNDDAATLEALMRAFVEARVKPYYLHHPDLAPGTGHFRLDIAEGQQLMRALHANASGLCQPTYVLDAPDGAVKAPLTPPQVRRTADGWEVQGADGVWRAHPPKASDHATLTNP
jgi:lysine 2,3-aminomutase